MPRINLPNLVLQIVQPLARFLLLALVLLSTACGHAKLKSPPAMPVVPDQFKHADLSWSKLEKAENQPRGQWWLVFNDPTLSYLCEKAKLDNASIHLAHARLQQAQSVLEQSKSNLVPQIGLGASASEQGGPLINAAGGSGTLYTGAVNAAYEVDIMRRIAKGVDASKLDAAASAALLANVELLVQANVANLYFSLRMLDDERTLLRDNLNAYQEILALTKQRLELGSVSELDLVRVDIERASIESELIGLDKKRAESEHALAVLVGEIASTFKLNQADTVWAQPNIPVGVPATLLARRPDIAAAQREVMAAQARLGVSKRAWFPNLTLNGGVGSASTTLSNFFAMSMRSWSYGLIFGLPLFDGGRREATLFNANATVNATVAMYREKFLIAFKEIEDSISGLYYLSEQEKIQNQVVLASQRAIFLSDSRYLNGLASQLDVLDARRNALKSKRAMIQLQAAKSQTLISMIRALGGGWDTANTQ